jgi:hypothetical protein
MEHLVGRMLTPESLDGRLELKSTILAPPISKRCPSCHEEHRRTTSLNNHVVCKCGVEFCWHDLQKWDLGHKKHHLIG